MHEPKLFRCKVGPQSLKTWGHTSYRSFQQHSVPGCSCFLLLLLPITLFLYLCFFTSATSFQLFTVNPPYPAQIPLLTLKQLQHTILASLLKKQGNFKYARGLPSCLPWFFFSLFSYFPFYGVKYFHILYLWALGLLQSPLYLQYNDRYSKKSGTTAVCVEYVHDSFGERGGIVHQNLGNPKKWLSSRRTRNAQLKSKREYRIFIKHLLRKEKMMWYWHHYEAKRGQKFPCHAAFTKCVTKRFPAHFILNIEKHMVEI